MLTFFYVSVDITIEITYIYYVNISVFLAILLISIMELNSLILFD